MVDEAPTIGICDSELPPRSEIDCQRYDYTPCSLKPCEVMPNHLFLHYFYDPAPHYNNKWMRRMPKKLKRSIFSSTEQIPVGWGLHIIQGPNLRMISMVLFIGLVISGVFSVIWAVFSKDIQGAFGVGGYAVAIQVAWMTMMFFRWSQQ